MSSVLISTFGEVLKSSEFSFRLMEGEIIEPKGLWKDFSFVVLSFAVCEERAVLRKLKIELWSEIEIPRSE